MFHQKQSIRPIQQIKQEKCLNCNKLISQSLIRNHQAICAITISNKDQELLDEQLAMLIQQNKIESKIFLLPNPSDSIQQTKTQQEIQIENKEVPSQIKQVFQSNNLNGQYKEAIFRQEQREFNDDLNFQKNELKNKHNLTSQEQIEKNIQKNDLNSQQIQQNMVFNTVQSQVQAFKNSQKCTIQNSKQQEAAQRDFDYAQNNSIQKNLENQSADNPQIIVQHHNNQISRNIQVEKQQQVQNYPQNNYCQMKNEELIKQRQISDEKKLENGQFDKANQLNQFNGFNYEQINQIYSLNNHHERYSLKDKQQNQNIHQQQKYQINSI
ncbi:unnamed protein product [Paramecium pentaurelia]|uniref:Uncharacterized protein n=1 Tax=Paramecium pentaurelia TaxID=43138 RepID=A0A8S1TAJ8_9CILI|nr:unnamed protein product [Paramecium pentaurelia]